MTAFVCRALVACLAAETHTIGVVKPRAIRTAVCVSCVRACWKLCEMSTDVRLRLLAAGLLRPLEQLLKLCQVVECCVLEQALGALFALALCDRESANALARAAESLFATARRFAGQAADTAGDAHRERRVARLAMDCLWFCVCEVLGKSERQAAPRSHPKNQRYIYRDGFSYQQIESKWVL